MRIFAATASLVVATLIGSQAFAADLALPKKEAVVSRPVATPVVADQVCLRFVEQTYSWYNYCDPIPYYGRNKYPWSGGLFSGG
jgi:hypothetical protein